MPSSNPVLSFPADLNNVRFSAYRTAMKLRRLQKALCCKCCPSLSSRWTMFLWFSWFSPLALVTSSFMWLCHDLFLELPTCVYVCVMSTWLLTLFSLLNLWSVSCLRSVTCVMCFQAHDDYTHANFLKINRSVLGLSWYRDSTVTAPKNTEKPRAERGNCDLPRRTWYF